jgi:transcriptional regulator with XRE-family HTH domain
MMTGPTDTNSSLGRPDDPAYYEALGRAVRVLRTERGLERKDLAGAAGMSYAYLSEIETGKKRPSSKALFVIAEALGVRPAELLALGDRYAGGPAGAAPSSARPSDPPQRLAAPPPPASRPSPVAAASEPAAEWRWFERGGATAQPAPMQRGFSVEAMAAAPDSEPRSEPPDERRRELLERLGEAAAALPDDDLAALLDLARRMAR